VKIDLQTKEFLHKNCKKKVKRLQKIKRRKKSITKERKNPI